MFQIITKSDTFDVTDTLVVDNDVISMSSTLSNILLDTSNSNEPINLTNISTASMESIIDFCIQYNLDDSIKEFDESFLKNKDFKREITITHEYLNKVARREKSDLICMLIDADYLGLDALVEFIAKALANMIKGKNPEELREEFDIENNYTEEEERLMFLETTWCV